ncbi:site-specific integrase [Deinococcus aetherius]|uniref:Site-specific integrase n=1 Tax=Deinococcus aetherius TaxID=200252 RepID=A0ABM8AFP9_9DEIO|nr:site-specific integrase [Deinococcus aetherius]
MASWRGLASYQDPETGERRRKSVSRKTREQAERALRGLIRSLPKTRTRRPRTAGEATWTVTGGPDSLGAYLGRWLEHKRRGVRPSTYRMYVTGLRPVDGPLGERELTSLTVLDIQALVDALCPTHGPRAAGQALHLLRMALRQAIRWQLLPANVAEHVDKPRVEREEMTVWTPRQAGRFLEVADGHRLGPLFTLALGTGLRRGELLALTWEDLDFGERVLTVRRSLMKDERGREVVGVPKTRASRRRIVLAQDVLDTLHLHWEREHRGGKPPEKTVPVFPSASGNHVEQRHLQRTFEALIQEAEVPRIRFHDLRHTAASLLIRQGVPPKVVSDRLGHRNVAFTLQVYTHVYDDQREAAALPLSRLLSGGPGVPPGKDVPGPDLTRGLNALHRWHAALTEFLREAPEWAQRVAVDALPL